MVDVANSTSFEISQTFPVAAPRLVDRGILDVCKPLNAFHFLVPGFP